MEEQNLRLREKFAKDLKDEDEQFENSQDMPKRYTQSIHYNPNNHPSGYDYSESHDLDDGDSPAPPPGEGTDRDGLADPVKPPAYYGTEDDVVPVAHESSKEQQEREQKFKDIGSEWLDWISKQLGGSSAFEDEFFSGNKALYIQNRPGNKSVESW